MKWTDLVTKLQVQNPGKMILMKNGIFFVAIGKDAVELNKLLGLKLTCIKPQVCKVGFQVKNYDKYINLLKDKGKSFALYTYDNVSGKEEKIFDFNGEKITQTKSCNDCSTCGKQSLNEDEIIKKIKNMK